MVQKLRRNLLNATSFSLLQVSQLSHGSIKYWQYSIVLLAHEMALFSNQREQSAPRNVWFLL